MITIGGLFFPDDERHFQLFGEEVANYQRPQRERAFSYVKDWRRAVDVGANVGIFARHFAEKFEEVVAIEPLPCNIECLRKNVPGNVAIKQLAVGDRHSTVTMYQTPKNVGGSFICDHDQVETPPMKNMREDLKVVVDMVTLDSLELDAVGLIKLDIQGSETIALRGGEKTLRRCRPVVLIEEKPLGSAQGSTRHIEEAASLLASYGMTPKERVGADRIYIFE